MVIVGTADGIVHAVDGGDGSTRWQFDALSNHPFFWSSLATDRGAVYAAAGDGLVFALRLEDGSLLWQQQLPYAGPPVGRRFDMDVHVVAGGGVVAVSMHRQDSRGADARSITVLEGATGAQRWVYTPRMPPWKRLLRALSPLTSYFPDPIGVTLLAVDATGVYVTTSSQQAGKAPTCVTSALDLARGRQRWRTRRAAAQAQFPSKSNRTSLAMAGRMVYTLDTHLSALEASTGRMRWQRPAPPAARSGVLAADATVVCAACESHFAVYRAHDGAPLWQLDRREEMGPFLGMALMDETVYVSGGTGAPRDSFTIEARNAVTGTLRWTWPAPTARGQEQEEVPARPDLSWRFVGGEGMLYVPGPGSLCAVRASDGIQLWQRAGRGLPALVAV